MWRSTDDEFAQQLFHMLHVTNGDSAREGLIQAGMTGPVLPWRDVLHEGPVPAGPADGLRRTRAQFLAGTGWGTFDEVLRLFEDRDRILASFREHEEVVLWFEHDLYDQLQLIQVLDFFAGETRGDVTISLICNGEFIGPASPEQLRTWFPLRVPVSPEQMQLACDAWAAFRSSDPSSVQQMAVDTSTILPYLPSALRRHLEQFPSVRGGLPRTGRQALRAFVEGAQTPWEAYAASQAKEEAIFLGDSWFALALEQLGIGPSPLLRFQDGSAISPPHGPQKSRDFWQRRMHITSTGEAVLAGEKDWPTLKPVDCWLGRFHLLGPAPEWRWDEDLACLRHMSAQRG
jgi:hypothetical protein